ncbi:MAG: lysophospholipid acyltransferase family protein [Phycisphaerae bacterium]
MPKRKNKTRNPIADYLVYVALRLFETVVHILGVSTSYAIARFFGDLMYKFDRKHRRIAMEHLRRSFPDWDEPRRAKVARECCHELMFFGLELMLTTRLVNLWRWKRYIRLRDMSEPLRMVIERERGMIFLTGHYGNFEVAGYTMATLGLPTVSVARMQDNRYLNEHLLGIRQKKGQTILDKKGATAEIPNLLQQGEVVCLVADQDAGRKGVFVDFFGRKASTYKSFGLMAMNFNVPVVVGYGRRLGDTYKFEVGVQRIIQPEEWADKDDPLRWITEQYTHALEDIVREQPGQYWWFHRRWKHRPRGEQQPKDGIA